MTDEFINQNSPFSMNRKDESEMLPLNINSQPENDIKKETPKKNDYCSNYNKFLENSEIIEVIDDDELKKFEIEDDKTINKTASPNKNDKRKRNSLDYSSVYYYIKLE